MTGSDEQLARVSYLPGASRAAGPVVQPVVTQPPVDLEVLHLGRAAAHGVGTERGEGPRGGDDRADGDLDDDRAGDSRRPEADGEACYQRAVKMLARRDHSVRELERALAAAEFEPEAIAEAVGRAQDSGYLDDLAAAQTLVGRLQERKGYGRQAIAAELVKRRFSPGAIEYALDLVDSGDELARCREIAMSRAKQLAGQSREVAERRLGAYLQRRGYSGAAIRAAVSAALASGTEHPRVRFR